LLVDWFDYRRIIVQDIRICFGDKIPKKKSEVYDQRNALEHVLTEICVRSCSF
jgi:ribosomal protein S24E